MKRTLLLFCTLLAGAATAAAQTVSVTFQVDMRVQILKGAFNPSTNTLSARGSFNDWGETAMADADTDSVYTVSVPGITANSSVAYKFFHSGGTGTWEDGDNKQVNVTTNDTTLAVHLFNGEMMPSGAPANVTFEADMRLIARQNTDFASRKVYVAGSFTDWGNSAVELTDANTDSIFTVTTPINSGQLINYKFIHSLTTASAGSWEDDPNKTAWIVDGDQTISRPFNNIDPDVTLADGNILFQVDMSVMSEIGTYSAVTDSVRWYSSFNGWNDGGDPSTWRMTQDFSNPLLWTINVPMSQQQVGGTFNYKFYVELDSAKAAAWTDGWERPISQGGGNRDVDFEGSPSQEVAVLYYDDIPPDYVIPNNTNLSVTFRVDMTGASSATLGAFTPGTDSLFWICEQPSFVFSQGWTDSDTMKVLKLTDDDANMVYEGTLQVADPTFNAFEYRYAFRRGSDWANESAGFGDNAYRTRYVGQSAARTFPTNPWTMPMDSWNDSGTQPQESDPYASLTFVRDDEAIAVSYELQQNFPNPFNPSTTIKFSLTGKELVTLRVYDMLGQEVATLVNQELVPGAYTVAFDGAKLSTGVYLYRLSAGMYVETKRMLFLK